MSSKGDPHGHLKFSLRIAGWFFLIFAVAALGLYFVTGRLVRDALEEEWELTHSELSGTLIESGGVENVQLREVATRIAPPPEVLEAVDRQVREEFPKLAVPIVLLGLLGGFYITYRSARQVRRVVRSVQSILESGEIHRRVSTDGLHGSFRETAELFNHALAHNESLVTGLHESLDAVAHDLRTPLTRLRATAERALSTEGDPDLVRDALADCMEESDDVLSMLHTLMDITEAGTGAMRLDLVDASVAEVVASVTELYELVAEQQGVALTTDVPADLAVRADPGRLRQLFANLVDNAIKYSDSGDTVRISAEADGAQVAVRVADTGRGIDPEDLPRIWDRLYRGDRSRHERGLGLGLSFVQAIVMAHGGTAEVESETGRGSVFTVRLPRPPDA